MTSVTVSECCSTLMMKASEKMNRGPAQCRNRPVPVPSAPGPAPGAWASHRPSDPWPLGRPAPFGPRAPGAASPEARAPSPPRPPPRPSGGTAPPATGQARLRLPLPGLKRWYPKPDRMEDNIKKVLRVHRLELLQRVAILIIAFIACRDIIEGRALIRR